ncbi:hypothetical protein OVA26_15935 [Microbacterium sp. SL62]|uniref:hypothetical protein n=1 Tax=Microbacterium sp. SL62 TaxID=2995139 RepID=UPI002276ED31|nr:hypothetical protein [Microbacterium sp. SL62]MCY1718425.1 hypothetical protein [Microbacterium sp. SL62]
MADSPDDDGPLNADAVCVMFSEEPFDFAWCETHDETFPLGSICRFHHKAPKTQDTPIPSQTEI